MKLSIFTIKANLFIGTFILIFFYLTSSITLACISVLLTFILMLVILIGTTKLIRQRIKHKISTHVFRKSLILIGLNIPLVLLFFWGGICLSNSMRFILVNKTGRILSNLRINDQHSIQELEPNENEFYWINIKHDSHLSISYIKEGVEKRETIFGYVTSMNGSFFVYRIGQDSVPIDESDF